MHNRMMRPQNCPKTVTYLCVCGGDVVCTVKAVKFGFCCCNGCRLHALLTCGAKIQPVLSSAVSPLLAICQTVICFFCSSLIRANVIPALTSYGYRSSLGSLNTRMTVFPDVNSEATPCTQGLGTFNSLSGGSILACSYLIVERRKCRDDTVPAKPHQSLVTSANVELSIYRSVKL